MSVIQIKPNYSKVLTLLLGQSPNVMQNLMNSTDIHTSRQGYYRFYLIRIR